MDRDVARDLSSTPRPPSTEGPDATHIDTSFDVRADAGGRDPDASSPTLRRYHQLLWSKQLPNGAMFDLDTRIPRPYLHHHSELGEYFLSSDSVMQTFVRHVAMQPIISQLPDEANAQFMSIGYTVGAMMVFPANRVDGKVTVNSARGMRGSIADRFDLTLECIRRYYVDADELTPLSDVLRRYANFFSLFDDFAGYVGFFLLQDLVTSDGQIRFFTPFDDFSSPARPQSLDAYLEFRLRSIEFIEARNRRIDAVYGPDAEGPR